MTVSVQQLRVVVNTENIDEAVSFYRDALGLSQFAAYAGVGDARVVILEAGRATLELANPAQSRFIAAVETNGVPSSDVRLAFEVEDATGVSRALTDSGAVVISPPVRTPWNSLNARFAGPAAVQVTIFQELDAAAIESVGIPLADLGGESGELERLVRRAARIGAAGVLPFAASVVSDGVVIGTGVNSALADFDPSAHGEVVAIRDATRRSGSLDLGGATVYSSCEPCAICRTVAAAAGVAEIVFAAGREHVPAEFDPAPEQTHRLMDAVADVLPGIARQGRTTLDAAQLTEPFRAYLATVSR